MREGVAVARGDQESAQRILGDAYRLADACWQAGDRPAALLAFEPTAGQLRYDLETGTLPRQLPAESVRAMTGLLAPALVGRVMAGQAALAELLVNDLGTVARRSPDPTEALRHFVRAVAERAGPDASATGRLERELRDLWARYNRVFGSLHIPLVLEETMGELQRDAGRKSLPPMRHGSSLAPTRRP